MVKSSCTRDQSIRSKKGRLYVFKKKQIYFSNDFFVQFLFALNLILEGPNFFYNFYKFCYLMDDIKKIITKKLFKIKEDNTYGKNRNFKKIMCS